MLDQDNNLYLISLSSLIMDFDGRSYHLITSES